MLINYLKISLRGLARQPGYSFLNIGGFAAGLTCCLLMALFVQDEFNFDRFHERGDRIYRVPSEFRFDTRVWHSPNSSMALASYLPGVLPEIESVVRIKGLGAPATIRHHGEVFYEYGFLFADPGLFTVFSFPLKEGIPGQALRDPFTVVLTSEIAEKYFPGRSPMGEVMEIHWADTSALFRVCGVAENVPGNSSLQFDLAASLSSALQTTSKGEEKNWLGVSSRSFVQIAPTADRIAVNALLSAIVKEHAGERTFYTPYLQPLTDIHLNRLELGVPADSDIRNVYIFGALALILLIIASINYMNLSTARASIRMREIGVRKVLGAARREIATQFLVESLLSTAIAFFFALIAVEVLLPIFNSLVDKSIELRFTNNPDLIVGFLFMVTLTGIASGSYPALYLSGFQPLHVLHPLMKQFSSKGVLRQILVVSQFTASIALLIGTVIVGRQLDFIRNKELGFDREQVVVIPFRELTLLPRAHQFLGEVRTSSGVSAAALGSSMPVIQPSRNGVLVPKEENQEATMMPTIAVDYETAAVLGLEMTQGRWFSQEHGSDEREGFVINEAAALAMGLEYPLGSRLHRNEQKGRIIGVVRDFHFRPLHHPIEPLVLFMDKGRSPFWMYLYSNVMVKVRPNAINHTLNEIKATWKATYPEKPFEYSFLDDQIQAMYQSERRFGKLFAGFAFASIGISCLGLFGLAAFSAERRTKEIGIRKVLGASIPGVVILLSREFLKLVFAAFLIASPLAYVLMSGWLEDFAYRVDIGVGVFLISGIAATLIALLTVSIQAIRAAISNPVEALRYE